MNLEFLISTPRLVATDSAAIMGAELTSICPQGQDTTRMAMALEISAVTSATAPATARTKGM